MVFGESHALCIHFTILLNTTIKRARFPRIVKTQPVTVYKNGLIKVHSPMFILILNYGQITNLVQV